MNFAKHIKNRKQKALKACPPPRKPAHSKDLKANGFTMAECLIALTIIGIIAMMVIPSTMKKVEREQRLVKFKIAYNLLQTVTTLSLREKDYPPIGTKLSDQEAIFNTYFAPYLKIAKTCGSGTQQGKDRCFASPNGGFYNLNGTELTGSYGSENFHKVILQNGMSLGYVSPRGGNNFFSSHIFVIDIDGPAKGYSKLGQDTFYFSYASGSQRMGDFLKEDKGPALIPGGLFFYSNPTFYFPELYNIRWGYGNRCSASGASGNGRPNGCECSTQIIKSGLTYPPNYPWDMVDKRPEGFQKY